MRPVIVKAYGGLSPAGEDVFEAVRSVLQSWFIEEDAVELVGDMVTISYEGDAFPDDDVVDALRPFLCESSWGKLDVIDLEAWTLHRYTFAKGELTDNTTTLDKALDPCALH